MFLYCSKKLNPYEKVGGGIQNKINRAYYKLWELCWEFHLLPVDGELHSMHLCEAPGGFINAVTQHRMLHCPDASNDTWVAVSRPAAPPDIPDFDECIQRDPNGEIKMCDVLNPVHFSSLLGTNERFGFITADGGIDVSENFNLQEQLVSKLFFAQMAVAVSNLKPDGHFVLKIYTVATKTTETLIRIGCSLFKTVHLCKPNTSRPTNSECYIICKHFCGQVHDIKEFVNQTLSMLSSSSPGEYCCCAPAVVLGDDKFSKRIRGFDKHITDKQASSIAQILHFCARVDESANDVEQHVKRQKTCASTFESYYRLDKFDTSSSSSIKIVEQISALGHNNNVTTTTTRKQQQQEKQPPRSKRRSANTKARSRDNVVASLCSQQML